ncbi:TetR/AcrR family transcriptional regulator [Microvirga terricola]|uniref:TetR/AcrR family transcriptional regulator n=1 Tax=Microvirga terricola TaxID=2719797 RepID=A0ABX0VEL3_9HYPH|nr:TetR/AcrR family transcriptional regulator [Microvirga terricola]NIX78279.1 TetR/AcrR family transcriptional regulator [Microvirga terricola]
MFKCIRGRKNSRERILDAAAELVSEIGSGRLTLDAVAERAGLSKGGLLYNFPSKDALLQGMIQRMIDEASTQKEALREKAEPGPNLEARLCTATVLNLHCGNMREIANGLLAASSENPRLLEPVRHIVKETFGNLKDTCEDLDASLLAWLAVEGLTNLEMHDLSPFSEEDRARIVASVNRLLHKGIAA